jgi:hypothetical protein
MLRKSILTLSTLFALTGTAALADDSQVYIEQANAPASASEPAPAPIMQGKGQALMESVIVDLIQGKTDLTQIQPMARVSLFQQTGVLTALTARLQSFGDLQSVTYAGMQNGMEVYDVRFANASMIWGTTIAPDGKMAHIRWKFH